MIFWIILLFSGICKIQSATSCDANIEFSSWNKNVGGKFEFEVPETTKKGWTIDVTFSEPIKKLKVWDGKKMSCDGNVCTFNSKNYNKKQTKGEILALNYQVKL